MFHCILSYIHIILCFQPGSVIYFNWTCSNCKFPCFSFFCKSSIHFSFVAKPVYFLKFFNHFVSVFSSLAICDCRFSFLFIEFIQNFFFVTLSWYKINRMIFIAFSWHIWVFNYSLLRTRSMVLSHLLFFSYCWHFLGLNFRIINFRFFFCAIHTIEHVSNVISSAEFLPYFRILTFSIRDLISILQIVLGVNLFLRICLLIIMIHFFKI